MPPSSGIREESSSTQKTSGMKYPIHPRIQMNKELGQLFLAAIVESADDAIIGKTLESIVTSWNRGAERIFGYTAEEMIGQSITRLIPPGHDNEEPEIIARLRKGDRIEHYETQRK